LVSASIIERMCSRKSEQLARAMSMGLVVTPQGNPRARHASSSFTSAVSTKSFMRLSPVDDSLPVQVGWAPTTVLAVRWAVPTLQDRE
jgi:hypothetical protein